MVSFYRHELILNDVVPDYNYHGGHLFDLVDETILAGMYTLLNMVPDKLGALHSVDI